MALTRRLGEAVFFHAIPREAVCQALEALLDALVCSITSDGNVSIPSLHTHFEQTTGRVECTRTTASTPMIDRSCFYDAIMMLPEVIALVQGGMERTQRDMYYNHCAFIKSSNRFYRAVRFLCIMLQIPRRCLGLRSTSKGLFSGPITVTARGDTLASTSSTSPIPWAATPERPVSMVASGPCDCILVVEKDSTFQQLINDNIHRHIRALIITARGYPDVDTRHFVKLAAETLQKPVMILTDGDPSGIHIFSCYANGSEPYAPQCHELAVPSAQWMGIWPSEADAWNVPASVKAPITSSDRRKLMTMLNKPQYEGRPRREMEFMQASGVKLEIEAFNEAGNMQFLSHQYIPTKLAQLLAQGTDADIKSDHQ
eukprot:m.145404 g.145404  ORF g.145404 m.145404 type:complete len:371 (+) comp14142_c0_seq7:238-1350(+)